MAFSYFYSYIEFNQKNGAHRPTVPLQIEGYEFTGLVDSGSDAIVIPKEVAEALNLKKIDETELSQLDGSMLKCDIAEIEIEFGKGHENYKFKTRTLICESPRIILGRNGFFNKFKITFDEDKELISFKKVDPLKKVGWAK